MGWLAGCGAPCWLATQLNRLIPKYICVLHWNFVLPHCPAQARLPGADFHPPSSPLVPNTPVSLARLEIA